MDAYIGSRATSPNQFIKNIQIETGHLYKLNKTLNYLNVA